MKVKQFLKRVVAAGLAVATMVSSLALDAFADNYNGGGGGAEGTFVVQTGVTQANWGYRFAIVDHKTGALQTNEDGINLVVDQVGFGFNSELDQLCKSANTHTDNFIRTDMKSLGGIQKRYVDQWFPGMPKPVNCGTPFTGNGELLKEWMMQKRADGATNAQYVIDELFGEDVVKNIKTGKYKLTIEPVIIFPLYNRYEMIEDAFGTGVYIEAPGYGWTSFSGKFVYGTYMGAIKALANIKTITGNPNVSCISGGLMKPAIQISAQCMILEEDDLGLVAPENTTFTDYVTWGSIGNQGYGIHIYSASTGIINTYDIDNKPKEAAKSEEPTEEKGNLGTVTIYKVYGKVQRDEKGGVLEIEDMGEFIREECASNIVITEEGDLKNFPDSYTGYKLKAWTADNHKYTSWKYSSGSKKGQIAPLTASSWVNVESDGSMSFNTKRNDGQRTFAGGQWYFDNEKGVDCSEGAKLTYSEEEPLELHKKNKTIYLLYLSDSDIICTFGEPTGTPDVYDPEDPGDNPGKKGKFSIVKCYGEYNPETKKVKHIATTYMKDVCYMVNIVDEPVYHIQEWFVVDSNPDIAYKSSSWWKKGESAFNKVNILQAGLNIPEGYNEIINCKVGMPKGKKGTLYVLYLKPTEPDPEEGKTGDKITESYLARRFMLGKEINELNGEKFAEHVFKWKTPKWDVPGDHDGFGGWCDVSLKFKIDQTKELDISMGIIPKWSDITRYNGADVPDLSRRKRFEIETGVSPCYIKSEKIWELKNLEFFVVLYRKDDIANLYETTLEGEKEKNEKGKTFIENTEGVFKWEKKSSERQENGNYEYEINLSFNASGECDYNRCAQVWDWVTYVIFPGRPAIPAIPPSPPNFPGRPEIPAVPPVTGKRKEYQCIPNVSSFDGSTAMNAKWTVDYDVYKGKEGAATENVGPSLGLNYYDVGNLKESGVTQSVGTIEVRPYIRMMYDTEILDKEETYVTGEYMRKMTFNEYVGVEFTPCEDNITVINTAFNDVKGKLSISSSQWSNHATANDAMNGQQNCVLPGGATLDVMIMKNNRQTMTVTGYFPILAGTGKKQVEETGGTNSGIPNDAATGRKNFISFVMSVERGLETWNMAQWVTDDVIERGDTDLTNVTKPVWDMTSLNPVEVSKNDGIFGTTTDETKYYFTDDNDYDGEGNHESSNTGDLDVKKGFMTEQYYTFFTDTAGNILVKVAGDLEASAKINDEKDGTIIVRRSGDSANDLSNLPGIYADIDEKTGAITKLYYGLESSRKTAGVCDICTAKDENAPWAPDGKWYNEAYDGITVLAMTQDLTIGFTKPGTRTQVLDPKLTGEMTNKADLLTKYRFCQFRMKDHSELYGRPGVVGTYGGAEVIVNGMEDMFISDIFYIPNATVQDLR